MKPKQIMWQNVGFCIILPFCM